MFSTGPRDLGYTRLVEHEINRTDDKPYREPYGRLPPSRFDEVREYLREMLEIGAIRESSSPYSSNLVLVRKSDGSLPLCIDYRGVNRKTIKDAHSSPRIEDTLDCLSGARFFTKLDLRSAYWQCAVKESEKPKTAFNLGPLAFCEFNGLPFGLTNACSTFNIPKVNGALHG